MLSGDDRAGLDLFDLAVEKDKQLSQYVQWSSLLLHKLQGPCQGLVLSFACVWALVTLFTVAYSADLCGSLSSIDHCFGHHNNFHLLAQLGFFTALVAYCHFSIQPFPPLIGTSSHTVSTGLGKLLHWTSFSVTMLVVGNLQGWFPLKGLLWNLLTVPYIFTGPPTTFDGTSSLAHYNYNNCR